MDINPPPRPTIPVPPRQTPPQPAPREPSSTPPPKPPTDWQHLPPQLPIKQHRGRAGGIILVIVFILLLAGAGYWVWQSSRQPAQQSATPQPVADSPAQFNQRLIFSVRESATETDEREFPIYTLWHQDDTAEPTQIGQLPLDSDKQSYINGFVASSDGRFIYVYYENKVQRINVDTRELAEVWKPEANMVIDSAALGPDGTKLYISSHREIEAGQPEARVTVVELDLSTGAATTKIDDDNNDSGQGFGLHLIGGNQAGKWFAAFQVPKDGFFYSVIDINQAELPKVLTSTLHDTFSPDGTVLFKAKDTIKTACSFNSEEASSYELSNPLTGESISSFSLKDEFAQIVEFSRDGGYALVQGIKPIKKGTECQELTPNTIYSLDIQKGELTKVDSAEAAYKLWYGNDPHAYLTDKDSTCTLHLLNGQTLADDETCTLAKFTIIALAEGQGQSSSPNLIPLR